MRLGSNPGAPMEETAGQPGGFVVPVTERGDIAGTNPVEL
jgi:hypothetical protein